jgi:hypothetical protein
MRQQLKCQFVSHLIARARAAMATSASAVLIASLAAGALGLVERAEAIPVPNFSFDDPDLGHNAFSGERFAGDTSPAWFTTGTGATGYGVFDPWSSNYTGTDGPVLPGTADSAQVGFLNLPAPFSNNFTYIGTSLGNFVLGQTYELKVAVGGRKDGGLPPSLYTVTLLAGVTPAGTGASGAGVADTFYDLSYSFTATAAEAGLPIGISLAASNNRTSGFSQANFDNVRLTLVPEPSSLTILAIAAIGLPCFRRRKRSS